MYTRLIILVFCAVTFALPLNINLGAFSPALVVGDGEISFGKDGEKEAGQIFDKLAGSSGGAENAAAGKGAAAAAKLRRSISSVGKRAKTENSTPRKVSITRGRSNKRSLEGSEESKSEKRDVEERDLEGFKAALLFADGALTKGPSIDLGTGEGGSGVGITVRPPAAGKQ
ncbi:hypothetical protein GcC1_214051 [Golovinomyces cichoracearum]|uniref:Uncharacterized protein n=1 Tax=Golovinomyces cichoracearum TaxID=62708 RepID=A0A420H9N6_9PEZI|nr:hypothetical protein GcC1_214051 [Golovinomyces cichoracearum]